MGSNIMSSSKGIADLLREGPRVLNVGVRGFAETLAEVDAPHVHVDWRPPAGGDPELVAVLARLEGNEHIDAANKKAIERILAADPVWEDVRPAREIWPDMDERVLLHAGPPIEW